MQIGSALQFLKVTNPILAPVTKFGGQPVWLNEPEWPLSRQTGNPMRFICQIALDQTVFPGAAGKMAYIFMTDEADYVDGTWEPDGGENAVIIQPASTPIGIATSSLAEGPTLYEMVETPGKDLLIPKECEYAVELALVEDPLFQPEQDRRSWSNEEFEEYASALEGNKVGGTPIFLQGDEFPGQGEWRLLLQLDSTQIPFSVHFGDAGIAYAFISLEGTVGKLLWQCA
jgi:uncharacterized protein YwqG